MRQVRSYLFTSFVILLCTPGLAFAKLIQITDAIHLGAGFHTTNTHFEQGRPYKLVSPRNLYAEVRNDIGGFYYGEVLDEQEWFRFQEHLMRNGENWNDTGEYVLKLEAVEILFWELVADGGEYYGPYNKGRFVFGDITLDKEVGGTESRFIFKEQDVLDYFVDQSNVGSELSFDYISTEGDAVLGERGFFETQYHMNVFRKSYEVTEPAHMAWALLACSLLLIGRKHFPGPGVYAHDC